MHPVCLKDKILFGRDQKPEYIFKQAVSWFAMKKHHHARWKASTASVVSISWSGLAFDQNEVKKKDYSFQNNLMGCLISTLAGLLQKSRGIWPSSLKIYPCNQKNWQQSWNLISAAQKYALKLELSFARIASGTVIYLFTADSPQTHFSEPVMSSTAGLQRGQKGECLIFNFRCKNLWGVWKGKISSFCGSTERA